MSLPAFDGAFAVSPYSTLPLNVVSARVGGLDTPVGYAGDAPGFVSGALQVDVLVPPGASAGSASLTFQVNGVTAPGITVWLK